MTKQVEFITTKQPGRMTVYRVGIKTPGKAKLDCEGEFYGVKALGKAAEYAVWLGHLIDLERAAAARKAVPA
jgi:hypothetical protein